MVAPIRTQASKRERILRAMRFIQNYPRECTVRRMAESTGTPESTIRGVITHAVALGWVEAGVRKRSRGLHYILTEDGHSTLEQATRTPYRAKTAPPHQLTRWAEAVQAAFCKWYQLDPSRKVSVTEVARKLDLNPRTWRRWRSGESSPNAGDMAGLAVRHGFTFGFDPERGYWVVAVEVIGE